MDKKHFWLRLSARGNLLFLSLLVGLIACGGSTTELLEKSIEIVGLPADVKADITVTGPNGFNEKITGTKILKLPHGKYTLDAKDVTVGESTYFVSLSESQKTFESQNYTPIEIRYDLEAHLSITLRGLPTGVNADITLKGTNISSKPEGVEQKIIATTDLNDLRPGSYEIRVADVLSGFTYTPRVNGFKVSLEPGGSASTTIDYLTSTEVFPGLEGGHSIAVDGNTMVVGSLTKVAVSDPFYGSCYETTFTIGDCRGTVTVLQKEASGAWKPLKTLQSDSSRPDMFGYTLAISGDTVAVGAYKAGGVNFPSLEGAVYIFQRNYGGANNWGLLQKLTMANQYYDPVTNTGVFSGHSFGQAIALDQDILIVGDPSFTYDANGNGRVACINEIRDECSAGAVFVYRYNSRVNQWLSETQLYPTELVVVDPSRQFQASSFGASVAISGDAIFVGAPRRNADAGAVYIFDRNSLGETQKLLGTKTQENPFPYFGTSLAVSGDTLVVGAPAGGPSITSQGVVYAFQKNQTNNVWQEVQKISVSNESSKSPLDDTRLGRTLALKDNILAVGAPEYSSSRDDADQLYVGFVYLFTRQNGVWEFSRGLTSNTQNGKEHFGSSIAFDGQKIIIGTPGYNNDTGAFHVFE
jgi:FG-GAP repeat